MKKFSAIAALLLGLVLTCSAQFQIPVGGGSSSDNSRKGARVTTRTLTGAVLTKGDQPIANAVVYLKNAKTLAMKTYIAQSDGTYRFPELSPNIDYEVYAQKDGKKSNTKTLSQFDDRPNVTINLQIDISK